MNKTIAGSIAEFAGAFALMFVGGGAILNGGDLTAVALAHGVILAVTVSAAMHISGGQFNPAVSIALALTKKQPIDRAAVFIIAQLVGAAAAAFILKLVFPADVVTQHKLGATLGALSLGDAAKGIQPNMIAVVGLEAIATFLLMFVILGTAVDPRGIGKTAAIGGLGIGGTVLADILCFGPLTGASMNPSRSFGPALIGGHWDMHAAYWIGPIAGAAIAAILWKAVFEKTRD